MGRQLRRESAPLRRERRGVREKDGLQSGRFLGGVSHISTFDMCSLRLDFAGLKWPKV